ncbi:MAG: glycosyltransferase family 4 protein [Wenzhouxiangella sp.]
MKILIVTDAWAPQVNGVVRTLETTREMLERFGHEVEVLSPEGQTTLPCPGYGEIRLTLRPFRAVRRFLANRRFDAIHIATEGPLGLAARRWCKKHQLAFTTSCHTRFPEYLALRLPVPLAWSYAWLRWFHGAADRTMVRSPSQRRDLDARGFGNLAVWPGAVDTSLFHPRERDALKLPRPIALYAGRVAVEKNLDAFLSLDLPGSKVVVGDGPALGRLRQRYPDAVFTGYQRGEALAALMASADVFVFPSLTDTLGLVNLEAMACGVPVAAFPASGVSDLVVDGGNGAIDADLRQAVFRALAVDDSACIEFASQFTWEACSRRFESLLCAAGEAALDGYNPKPCESLLQAQKATSTALPS